MTCYLVDIRKDLGQKKELRDLACLVCWRVQCSILCISSLLFSSVVCCSVRAPKPQVPGKVCSRLALALTRCMLRCWFGWPLCTCEGQKQWGSLALPRWLPWSASNPDISEGTGLQTGWLHSTRPLSQKARPQRFSQQLHSQLPRTHGWFPRRAQCSLASLLQIGWKWH